MFSQIKIMRKYVGTAETLFPHVTIIAVCKAVVDVARQLWSTIFLGFIVNILVQSERQTIVAQLLWTFGIYLLGAFILGSITQLLTIQSEYGLDQVIMRAQTQMAAKMVNVSYSTFVNAAFRAQFSAVKTGLTYTLGFTALINQVIGSVVSLTFTVILSGGLLVQML